MSEVITMNGFCELSDVDLMETEGGMPWILIPIVVGLSLSLTGCNNAVDSKVHSDAGCKDYGSCVLEDADCPYN